MAYRYLGNKNKLSDWITSEIGKVLPNSSTIADPMCGTASVSEALAQRGHNVIASDALKFPTLHAKARLLNSKEPQFEKFGGYNSIINTINSITPIKGYFFNEFGSEGKPKNRKNPRLYFSANNAGKIDAIREFIKINYDEGFLSDLERDLLLHDLILAVNSVANIAGTYGYFRSALSEGAKVPLTINPNNFINTPGIHKVLQGEAKDILSQETVDGVYLDPPYTKRQYAGNYHILETIAMEDEPEAQGEGGLRPWSMQASDFCYKRKAERAFRDVIESTNARFVFISYSEDGQVETGKLLNLLRDYGEVEITTRNHSRYKSNGNAKGGSLLEFLYILEVNNAQ